MGLRVSPVGWGVAAVAALGLVLGVVGANAPPRFVLRGPGGRELRTPDDPDEFVERVRDPLDPPVVRLDGRHVLPPLDGGVTFGHNVQIGYLAFEAEALAPED